MKIDKDNIKIILILLVVCLGIGYSYLNTELNINGTANINSANWSVYWNNVQVESGSVTAPTPTIDSDKTTVSYSVTLEKPGDYYEFTVDAVNAGTIDAMIETIDSKLNGVTMEEVPAYLDYGISYADDTPLEENQELLHDSTETYKVHIGYSENIEANELPTTNQSLSLEFTVTYKQATDAATEVVHGLTGTRYTTNLYQEDSEGNWIENSSVWIGRKPTDNITLYNTVAEAKAAFSNRPFYLKHTIENDIVKDSYVCFEKDSNTYCLRGQATYEKVNNNGQCKSEFYDSENNKCLSTYYESNKTILKNAFGESNCTQYSSNLNCSVGGLLANAREDGYVGAIDDSAYCRVSRDGYSNCYE